MKIVRTFAHCAELPSVEGSYKWSGGKSVSEFDSTIIGAETECGLSPRRTCLRGTRPARSSRCTTGDIRPWLGR